MSAAAKPGPKGSSSGLISVFMRRVYSKEKSTVSTVVEEDEGEDDQDDIPEEYDGNSSTGEEPTTPAASETDGLDREDELDDGARTPVGSPQSSRHTDSSAMDNQATPVRARPAPTRVTSRGHARSVSDVASIDRESVSTAQDSEESDPEGRISADAEESFPLMEGTLSKWTNYINGWQDRHVMIREGTLSYYRSANEADICRAAVDLAVASVQRHKFDQFRFDVRFGDQCFYFRATTEAEKDKWVDAAMETQSRLIETRSSLMHKSSSMASLTSAASIGSGSIRTTAFQEKLTEIKTFHQMLTSLTDKIQSELPSAKDGGDGEGVTPTRRASQSQFRADCLMFKSTSVGMMNAVEECVAMANRREDEWRKRLAKANEKRRHFEKLYHQSLTAGHRDTSGPDMQEGPHSVLTEEEWFDAIAEADAQRESVVVDTEEEEERESVSPGKIAAQAEKDKKWQTVVKQLIGSSKRLREDHGLEWEEVLEDQNMVVFRTAVVEDDDREHEKSRVTGAFPGVCASELIEYYTNPDVKQLWDSTMETLKMIESDSECDMPWSIEYYTYRRIWPAAQRESVIILHTSEIAPGQYMSVSRTIKHEKVPEAGGRIQVKAQVALFAKTIIREGAKPPYTRKDVSTEIEYFTDVDPGGWAPSNVVQAVARREIPKTLRALAKGAKKWFERHNLPADLQLG